MIESNRPFLQDDFSNDLFFFRLSLPHALSRSAHES